MLQLRAATDPTSRWRGRPICGPDRCDRGSIRGTVEGDRRQSVWLQRSRWRASQPAPDRALPSWPRGWAIWLINVLTCLMPRWRTLAGIDFLRGEAIPPDEVALAPKEGWAWVRP